MLRRTAIFSALLVAALAASGPARPAGAAGPAPMDFLRSLPAGDVIATVDVATLVNKTLPAVLAGRPESLRKLDANIAKIQTDFGIDLRQVRHVAISASPYGAERSWVAVVDGRFDAALQPAAAAAAAEKYTKLYPRYGLRTETHEGTTVYVFPRADGVASGAFAVAVLDASTALYGTPSGVRQAIDARRGKSASAASREELVAAYEQSEAGAVIRFATMLPKELLQQGQDDPFSKSLSAIQSIFGSAGVAADNGLAVRTTARTASAADAKSVLSSLTAVVDLGRTVTGNKPELAALIEHVSLATSGNDVQMNVTVPAGKLDGLFRAIDKESGQLAGR